MSRSVKCSYNTWMDREGQTPEIQAIISKHDVNSWEKSFSEVTLFSTVGISWRISLGGGGGGGSNSFVKLGKIKQGNTGNPTIFSAIFTSYEAKFHNLIFAVVPSLRGREYGELESGKNTFLLHKMICICLIFLMLLFALIKAPKNVQISGKHQCLVEPTTSQWHLQPAVRGSL